MIESCNRAFMYGESVFTTMKMVDGFISDWELHFERLRRGVEFVYGPFTDGDDWKTHLRNRLEARWQQETGDKVVRLAVYRDQERGLQRHGLISVLDLKTHLTVSPFDPSRVEGRSLSLRTCAANIRPHWWPSYLKAGSYLETILTQRKTLKPGDDDVLFLSHDDTVLESSVANIFIVRHSTLYTAPPGPNVLDGIMRRKVLDASKEFFEDAFESETTLDQLYKADAVFGTNSLRGLFLVGRVDDHEITYQQDVLDKLERLRVRIST